jgi:hypothetical protein
MFWDYFFNKPEEYIPGTSLPMLPFDLGLFPWFEPIERFLIAANQSGIDYLTPKIGEVIKSGNAGGQDEWWKGKKRKISMNKDHESSSRYCRKNCTSNAS